MNINEAKIQTKNAIKAYLTKDKYGRYKIDRVHQRPVLIIGAPGIGKTAIMEQIARELNIGIVSYSMTHHTRQSAIGLPYIEREEFGGKEYAVSKYTMSEIIASVYNYIKNTGIKEGILFLDEINCVSETLSPAMLQFLQYKTFGNTPVPEGWVIVTAGNPPEYNKSVREFDVATLDRVKKIEVEPDFDVWKKYAVEKGVHNAIITYLDVKKDNFYVMETTIEGKSFATARGWEDLSEMIYIYEEAGVAVDESLICQYIQHKETARDFSLYYDLYNKYKSDYKVLDILEGRCTNEVEERAKNAKFDERLTLLGLLNETVVGKMKEVIDEEKNVEEIYSSLKNVKERCSENKNFIDILRDENAANRQKLEAKLISGVSDRESENVIRETIEEIDTYIVLLAKAGTNDNNTDFGLVKSIFNKRLDSLDEKTEKTKSQVDEMFKFISRVFGKGHEMALIVASLTANPVSAAFIGKYGSNEYFENNEQMLFYERQKDIMKEISALRSIE
jgi:hypothetical protein